jgi:hypothetical protein
MWYVYGGRYMAIELMHMKGMDSQTNRQYRQSASAR